MPTQIEGSDMGSWYENLTNRSTREKGVVDSSKRLTKYIGTNKTKQ